VLSESQLGAYVRFHCHVGHSFSLAAVVAAQTESLERALWSGVRALDESAALTQRLANSSRGDLRRRFEEKEQDHRRQADIIRSILLSPDGLRSHDAEALIEQGPGEVSE
jgi:two-component system chemotaxis response regulator CheB